MFLFILAIVGVPCLLDSICCENGAKLCLRRYAQQFIGISMLMTILIKILKSSNISNIKIFAPKKECVSRVLAGGDSSCPRTC